MVVVVVGCISTIAFDDASMSRYPPGHGDLYNALWSSGVLDSLLHDGKVRQYSYCAFDECMTELQLSDCTIGVCVYIQHR